MATLAWLLHHYITKYFRRKVFFSSENKFFFKKIFSNGHRCAKVLKVVSTLWQRRLYYEKNL